MDSSGQVPKIRLSIMAICARSSARPRGKHPAPQCAAVAAASARQSSQPTDAAAGAPAETSSTTST